MVAYGGQFIFIFFERWVLLMNRGFLSTNFFMSSEVTPLGELCLAILTKMDTTLTINNQKTIVAVLRLSPT